MMQILVASRSTAPWGDFLHRLQSQGYATTVVDSLETAQEQLRKAPPVLVILDMECEGKALAQAVISLLQINAGVQTAVVSTLSPEAFHTSTEGLGILMALPQLPGPQDADTLIEKLKKLQQPPA